MGMEKKKFYCKACKKPIDIKDDLAVVGKSFYTFHNRCFNEIKHRDLYAFYSGYKTNGWFPWIMLLILNCMLWGTYYFFHAPFEEVFTFSMFICAMTLLFRGISYIFYERYYG